MDLRVELDSLEGLDAAAQALYEQRDSKYYLKSDYNFVPADSKPKAPDLGAKVDEFRNRNVALSKDKERLQAELDKYADVDLDKYAELVKAAKEAGEKKAIADGDLDKAVAIRVEAMRNEYDMQVKKLKEALEKSEHSLAEANVKVDRAILNDAVAGVLNSDFKIRQGALPDLMARVLAAWRVEEGVPVAYSEGNVRALGTDGKDLLTMKEWVSGLQTTAPHLFAESVGGDAKGSRATNSVGAGKISWTDTAGLGNNLEGIASGKVEVS